MQGIPLVYFQIRKLKHTFLEEREDAPPQRKQPIQIPREEPQPPSPTSPTRAAQTQPPQQREPEPERISAATDELPKTRNLLAEGMPRRQDSDEEEEAQDWDGKLDRVFVMHGDPDCGRGSGGDRHPSTLNHSRGGKAILELNLLSPQKFSNFHEKNTYWLPRQKAHTLIKQSQLKRCLENTLETIFGKHCKCFFIFMNKLCWHLYSYQLHKC